MQESFYSGNVVLLTKDNYHADIKDQDQDYIKIQTLFSTSL